MYGIRYYRNGWIHAQIIGYRMHVKYTFIPIQTVAVSRVIYIHHLGNYMEKKSFFTFSTHGLEKMNTMTPRIHAYILEWMNEIKKNEYEETWKHKKKIHNSLTFFITIKLCAQVLVIPIVHFRCAFCKFALARHDKKLLVLHISDTKKCNWHVRSRTSAKSWQKSTYKSRGSVVCLESKY